MTKLQFIPDSESNIRSFNYFYNKKVNRFLGIIPARYASTRFPGKPLAKLGNKPMIQWVYERSSAVLPELLVATDDNRIKEAVENFGGKAVLTSQKHSTGTERCAEAMEIYEKSQSQSFSHIINIQGDEPLIKRDHLEAIKSCFKSDRTQIATLIQVLRDHRELNNPNLVKVVVDKGFQALFFSRSPLPYLRGNPADPASHTFYSHIGLYAFRSDVLRELVRLPESALEKAESLEQLRWLENMYSIQTALTDQPAMGVDTPEDLKKLARLI